MRIPKLRGFKNRFKIEFEVVNVGAIAAAVERGAFEVEAADDKKTKAKAPAQITINQDILRTVGLVRTLDKPLKILGAGELSAPLFVVADAFTASARTKIEAAGGSVNVLEIPAAPRKALGVGDAEAEADGAPAGATAAATPARTPRARKASPAASAEAAGADDRDNGGPPAVAEAEAQGDDDARADDDATKSETMAAATAEPEPDEESPAAETTSGDDA
jgi:ribosomal protein L15